MRFVVVVAIATGGWACNGAVCDLGEARCIDDDTLETCRMETDPETEPRWDRHDCDDDEVCTTSPTGKDMCALQTGAYPGCPLDSDRPSQICDGPRLVYCNEGLATEIYECAGTCFMSDGKPLCSLFPDKDPLCDGTEVTCVDPETRIECVDGWRIAERECGAEGGCVEFDAPGKFSNQGIEHRVVCSLEADQDPMCVPGVYDGYCRTNRIGITCWSGYVIQRTECAPTEDSGGPSPCVDLGNWVRCTTDIVSEEGSEYGN